MILLYETPGPVDLDGWRAHLEWLQTEPEEIFDREDAIERARFIISLLETPLPERQPDAP